MTCRFAMINIALITIIVIALLLLFSMKTKEQIIEKQNPASISYDGNVGNNVPVGLDVYENVQYEVV